MKRRFSKKSEPVTARRQLQYVRQQENETLEDFAHQVYVLALDGYEKCEDDALEDIATEAFLRGGGGGGGVRKGSSNKNNGEKPSNFVQGH